MQDNVTWCIPSDGYDKDNAVEIELDNYNEIGTVQGELPQSDEEWPKGAPFADCFKVGDKIYQKQS
jgi:hypothetical protein